jgi:hypothetical protein
MYGIEGQRRIFLPIEEEHKGHSEPSMSMHTLSIGKFQHNKAFNVHVFPDANTTKGSRSFISFMGESNLFIRLNTDLAAKKRLYLK